MKYILFTKNPRKILNFVELNSRIFMHALQIDTTTATLREPECLQALVRTK